MIALPTAFYYPFPRSWQLTVPCTDPVHLQLLAQATTALPAFATFPVILTYPTFALNGPVCSFHSNFICHSITEKSRRYWLHNYLFSLRQLYSENSPTAMAPRDFFFSYIVNFLVQHPYLRCKWGTDSLLTETSRKYSIQVFSGK